MKRPWMVLVAGPPGSGKSMHFPVTALGCDGFNVDERAAVLNGGSFRAIPRSIRERAQKACEAFVEEHIAARVSFAVETTLRSTIAIDQAQRAKLEGFELVLIFITTGDVEENIRRVRIRGLAGGHSAPEVELRAIYERSMANLELTFGVFDRIELYDSSIRGAPPRLVGRLLGGRFTAVEVPAPDWLPGALKSRS
jgi:predicted ABC-type ATPase